MLANPFDHAEADRLDRALDALAVSGSTNTDPSFSPLLRLMVANRPRPLATDARQRIWAQIAEATGDLGVPVELVHEGGSVMATPPRIAGERERTSRRERQESRWRPALEIAAVAILLLTLVGGLMNRQRHQPPTLPALMASPSAATTSTTPVPNPFEVTLHVDANGVRSGDPTALQQALQQLRVKLKGYQPQCRVGLVFTTGAGEIGPGNELGAAINNLLKTSFPRLIDQYTAFEHYAQPSLSDGTVQVDFYVLGGCSARSAATPGGEAAVPTASSLNPDSREITLHVDTAGVISGDPAAMKQALQQLQAKLERYQSPTCRIGMVLTTGAGDIGPGNELGTAINQLLQENFPQHIDSHTLFKHYAEPSLSPGTVQIDLYFFDACPALAGASASGSPIGTPTISSNAEPTAPYNLELVLRFSPPDGQTMAQSSESAEVNLLVKRAQALGLQIVSSGIVDGNIHLVFPQVEVPPTFIGQVLSATGQFEIIDPQGKLLPPGTLVRTTEGSPAGTPVPGPVYTTIVNSNGVEAAQLTSTATYQPAVVVSLIQDEAQQLQRYMAAHPGQPLAIVLDKRVLTTAVIQVTAGQIIITAVNPSVIKMEPSPGAPPLNPAWPAQNALAAILQSGPLQIPVAVDRLTVSQQPMVAPTIPFPVSGPAPTSPYSLELQLHLNPASGQTVSPSLLATARQVITKRAKALGLTHVVVTDAGNGVLRVRLTDVNLPPEFVEDVLSRTGQFEVIDSQGTYLFPGTAVNTSLGPAPGGVATGPVYSTQASSEDIVQSGTTNTFVGPIGSAGPVSYGAFYYLNDAAATKVTRDITSQQGAYLTYVLDKRVLFTQIVPPQTNGDHGVIFTLPPVLALGTPVPVPPPTTPTFLPQNALTAILASGPLPAPVTVLEAKVMPTADAWPATPAP